MKTQNFGYKKLYINGELLDAESGQIEDVICPATGDSIAQIAKAGKADAEKALNAARKGFQYWSKLSLGQERTEWMSKLKNSCSRKGTRVKNCYGS